MLKENSDSASLLFSMKKIWIEKREMSLPEAVFHTLSLPFIWKSRTVVYLAADYPDNQIRLIKHSLVENDKDDEVKETEKEEDCFYDGLIEYYQARPNTKEFESMPLITFAAWYIRRAISEHDDTGVSKVSMKIQLINNKGVMYKKHKKNVVRLPKLPLSDNETDKERYYFSKLMTYVPFRHPYLEDVLSGFEKASECFYHHFSKSSNISQLMEEYEKIKMKFKKHSIT